MMFDTAVLIMCKNYIVIEAVVWNFIPKMSLLQLAYDTLNI